RSRGASGLLERLRPAAPDRTFTVPPLVTVEPLSAHRASVDIIICVHNALEDTQRCLASAVRYTRPPYGLIVVDDGSDTPTRDYLERFCEEQGAIRHRNEQALGYTCAANQGLRA